jgi:hypothetical protein
MARRSFLDFEWTFSSRVRERKCMNCPALTAGFLTLRSGIRKPLCSTCFFSQMKTPPESRPSRLLRKPPNSTCLSNARARSEQLRLC